AGANPNQFSVGKFNSSWTYPTAGQRGSDFTEATGLTSFSDFQIGQRLGFTITATAGTGGTITPPGETAVFHGDHQDYTVAPRPHYHTTDVKVDGVSQGAISNYTFSI